MRNPFAPETMTFESVDYVDRVRPPLETSLFDDPERLERTWRATLASYGRERTPEEIASLATAGEEILTAARLAVQTTTHPE